MKFKINQINQIQIKINWINNKINNYYSINQSTRISTELIQIKLRIIILSYLINLIINSINWF